MALSANQVRAGTLSAAAQHSSTDYCSSKSQLSARVQDRLLRFAAIAQQQLQDSGHAVALVSRSGLELQRFGHRYSHAGISLREGSEEPWSVRQLYYACDECLPRLFDQGLPGFVFGTDNTRTSFLSITFVPAGPAQASLAEAAANKPVALELIAPRYSANAYAFSLRYQNCNQWLAELLGWAWNPAPPEPALNGSHRAHAQEALKQLGYWPQPTPVGSPFVLWAASFVPLLNLDDHPDEDRQALQLRVSMPSSLEAFVRQREPAAQRVELCQTEGRVVIRRGWQPLPDDCVAEAGDELVPLD